MQFFKQGRDICKGDVLQQVKRDSYGYQTGRKISLSKDSYLRKERISSSRDDIFNTKKGEGDQECTPLQKYQVYLCMIIIAET